MGSGGTGGDVSFWRVGQICESRSGGLRDESAEGQPCGLLPCRNHSLDRQRAGEINAKRNALERTAEQARRAVAAPRKD
jgi:hypothetical protein